MNTILINKEINDLNNDDYKIDIKINKLVLNITGNVNVYDNNKNDILDLTINITKDAKLNYYMFSDINYKNKNITINNYNNSIVNFNYSFINDSDCKLMLSNNILEDGIKSNLHVRSVAKNNANIEINSDGFVKKNTCDNEFNEDIRGLNIENGMISIKPNMFIDTNNVLANHNATIGNINKNYLFYLKAKGITEEEARKIIVNGFIKSILINENNEEFF